MKCVKLKNIKLLPRPHFRSMSNVELMGAIKKEGLLTPLDVSEDLTLLDGYRRYAALVELGIEEALVNTVTLEEMIMQWRYL